MKKIGIAVFALMFAGIAYVGAQEVEIDFDGKSDIQDVQNIDIVEAVKVNISDGVAEISEIPMQGIPLYTEAYSTQDEAEAEWIESFFSSFPHEHETYCVENSSAPGGLVCIIKSLVPATKGHWSNLNYKWLNNKKTKMYFKLQQNLRKIILEHYDKYPEFAESILPMLRDGKAMIMAQDGVVYSINGNNIIKVNKNATSLPSEMEKIASSNKAVGVGLTTVLLIANIADTINDGVNNWQEYSSWPPFPDSGTANNSGTSSGSHTTYHSHQGGSSNYDVVKSLK